MKKSYLLVAGVVGLVALFFLGYLGMKAYDDRRQVNIVSSPTPSPSASPVAEEQRSPEATAEAQTTPPPAEGQMVVLEANQFRFSPNEIRAKVGQPLRVVISSVDMAHDFVIDEFNVRSETIGRGKSATVEFSPDRAGSFEFYCSVGLHRRLGMVGQLIVEE